MRTPFFLALSCLIFASTAQDPNELDELKVFEEILSTRNPNVVLDILKNIDLEKVKIDSLRSYFYYYRGSAMGQLGLLDSALYFIDLSFEKLPENHPIIEIQILRAYGNIYWAKSFFNLALANYQRALDIAEIINEPEFQISLLGNIAGVHARLDNLILALAYAERAEVISKQSGVVRPRSHLKIGIYSLQIGQNEKGIESLKETIKLIQIDNRDSIALGNC